MTDKNPMAALGYAVHRAKSETVSIQTATVQAAIDYHRKHLALCHDVEARQRSELDKIGRENEKLRNALRFSLLTLTALIVATLVVQL